MVVRRNYKTSNERIFTRVNQRHLNRLTNVTIVFIDTESCTQTIIEHEIPALKEYQLTLLLIKIYLCCEYYQVYMWHGNERDAEVWGWKSADNIFIANSNAQDKLLNSVF